MTRLSDYDLKVDNYPCRTLDKVVCIMYGAGLTKDVNTLRFNKFTEK